VAESGTTNHSPATCLPTRVPLSWSRKLPERPCDRAAHPFNADEGGRAVRPCGLNETDAAFTLDVSNEGLGDFDQRQRGRTGWFFVRGGLVGLHFNAPTGAVSIDARHFISLSSQRLHDQACCLGTGKILLPGNEVSVADCEAAPESCLHVVRTQRFELILDAPWHDVPVAR